MFEKKKNTKKMDELIRIKGALFGFFVGDALGVPVEFISRDELQKHKVKDMQEYGTHNQPIGTWSDDSSMVIATIDSLIECNTINYNDIMERFLNWYIKGEYTTDGRAFDIGNTTSAALLKYKKKKETFKCGTGDVNSNGNGSLMRILPISLYLYYTKEPMFEIINNVSSMTHAHIYSVMSCVIYSVLINEYLKELDIRKAYLNMQTKIKKILEIDSNKILGDLDDLKNKFSRIVYNDIAVLDENDIKSNGYVIDSLEASIWCLLKTSNYQEAVLTAVNLGEDTDTIGALTGALAGLVYGYENIPKKWLKVLKREEYLSDLVDKFIKLLMDKNDKRIITYWQNLMDSESSSNERANPNSWKCIPFTSCIKIACNIVLTKEEFAKLSMGHIPGAMEDRWFMYCDNDSINYFRSWTGNQIFKGYYRLQDNSYIIYSLEINDNKEEYSEQDVNVSLRLFSDLVARNCKRK